MQTDANYIQIETDARNVRQTWFSQLLVLSNLGMAYNGDKRLLEFSQVLRGGPITASRHNGALRTITNTIKVDKATAGAELEQRWHDWISEESLRRAGYSSWVSLIAPHQLVYFIALIS